MHYAGSENRKGVKNRIEHRSHYHHQFRFRGLFKSQCELLSSAHAKFPTIPPVFFKRPPPLPLFFFLAVGIFYPALLVSSQTIAQWGVFASQAIVPSDIILAEKNDTPATSGLGSSFPLSHLARLNAGTLPLGALV
jgi:hypothetical protein